MKISIFRSILIGILVGILMIVATKIIFILLIVGAIFKLSGASRWKKEKWRKHKMDVIKNIREMSDEEFNNFQEKFGRNRKCCSH